MNAATLRPLSELIERSIRQAATDDTSAAIKRARAIVMKAYAAELEPHCGKSFVGVLALALVDFEEKISVKARQSAEQVRLQKMMERLQCEADGEQ